MKEQLPYLASWQLLPWLQGEDKGYQAGYKTGYESGLRKGGSGYNLRNPTYQEMKGFLAQDTTSPKTYMTEEFTVHISSQLTELRLWLLRYQKAAGPGVASRAWSANIAERRLSHGYEYHSHR